MATDVSQSHDGENQRAATRRDSSPKSGRIRDFATYKHQFHEQQHRDLEAKHAENPSTRLSQLRSQHHRFKGQLTEEELGADNDQAQALWQTNDRAAKRDVATDRGLRNAPNCAISLGHRPDRYMARGGTIIDGKATLADHLRDNEHKAFKSGRKMKHRGKREADFPPREREAYKLYNAVHYMNRSSKDYTVEDVNKKLDEMRRTEDYQNAFPDTHKPANQEGSSSSQEQPGSPSCYQPHYEGHPPSELGYYYAEGDTWDAWAKRKGHD